MDTGAHRATILIVDDDPDLIEVLDLALTDAGYRVAAAQAAEAVRVAGAVQPDLILLDLVMPGLDGAQVCRALRAEPRTAAIPIVLMSVYGPLAERARALPITAQLPKPFDLEALRATVARWVPA
jgi:CheY-like chemotaxis protein